MTGFLTIEDANTANLNVVNEFSCIDTSLIVEDDYQNKVYDFVKISKSGNDYILKIDNSLWTGGFYVTDSTGEYIDVTGDYSYDSVNNQLTITVSESNILVYLYLCSFYKNTYTSQKVEQLSWIQKHLDDFIDDFTLDLESLTEDSIEGCYVIAYTYRGNSWRRASFGYHGNGEIITAFEGVIYELHDENNNNRMYVKYHFIKPKLNLSCDVNSIHRGLLNKIKLTISSSSFAYIIDGYVLFNDVIIPIYKEGNDFYFDLDLRDYNHNHVGLKFILNENAYNRSSEDSFSFNIDYKQVTSESELLSLINNGGIITIADDLDLSDDILIIHNTKIIGNNHSIDLNGHSLILNEDIDLVIENLQLYNGDTAIIQGKNTKLDLTGVTFENCISSKYNNQGSCILCDIDINSLDNPDDYITNLKECNFKDNHNCIVHGGLLTVTDCTYENTDMPYSDKHNVGFLYQVDGEATITGSSFDINYISDEYCLNQESIGYAQAILKIGKTAIINNYSHEDFINNRFKFNNQCHVFCKYYYEKIGECVYTSPVNAKESESYCYSASGTNWVFKENVQVTKASSGRENTYNPLGE